MTELDLRIMWNKIEAQDLAYYKSAPEPEGVTVISNIPYVNDGNGEHLLDIIRPANVPQEEKLPVIINVHGGGFVYGYKDSYYKYYCMNLAKLGYAVLSINYRLAFHNPYPAQINDLYALANFIPTIQTKYGFDMEQIYMVGDSAGACLCALFCMIEQNSQARQLFDDYSPIEVKGLGLNCGLYDFNLFHDKEGTDDAQALIRVLFHPYPYMEHPYFQYANVIPNINSFFPPCFLMGTKSDSLFYQTEAMHEALEAAKVEHKYVVYDNPDLGHVFHLKDNCPESKEVMKAMNDFFRSL